MFGRKPRPDPIPPDRIPRDHVVQDPAWAVYAEQDARIDEAVTVLKAAMRAELRADAEPGEIRTHFEDACLEALSALRPSEPDQRDLREVSPVPVRHSVPVIPGRTS